ncbi:hypothetical protein PM082_019894 [Marasmius tenuissimus]|nr:hypothetical protein PM082_019894 [Marasmius tenuissimus]
MLREARNCRIGDEAVFQIAGRDQVTNIFNHSGRESKWITLSGNTYRRIPMGDIIIRRNVSLKICEASIERQRRSISETAKVKKTVQYVEILGLPGAFTSVTLEPVEENQLEDFKVIKERVCREMSSRRSPLFTHLVGLGWSERLILILPDELANGDEFAGQIAAEENWIVYYYLWYTKTASFFTLHGDHTLSFPISNNWSDWTFNPRTHTWQYDLPSISLSSPSEDAGNPSRQSIGYSPTPIHQHARPRLNIDEVVACFEHQFGDFLYVIASSGETREVKGLSDFVRHGLLTIGTIVDRNKPGILAYFPSAPAPEWYCESISADVKASYSTSVPSRIDLAFDGTERNRAELHFSLRLPDQLQYQTAYLSQSLSFSDECYNPYSDLALIDEIRLSLVGTFHHDPATSRTPVYLFVPPIPVEQVNNVYSIRYPLLNACFYWSSDPNGRDIIHEQDWEKYGIHHLTLLTWIGTSWHLAQYITAIDHLQNKCYPLDGRRFARDHCYPELVHGDPHDPWVVVTMEELDLLEDTRSDVRLSPKAQGCGMLRRVCDSRVLSAHQGCHAHDKGSIQSRILVGRSGIRRGLAERFG